MEQEEALEDASEQSLAGTCMEMTEAYKSVQVVLISKSYANKTSHRKLGSYNLPSSSSKSDNSILITPKHVFLLTDT